MFTCSLQYVGETIQILNKMFDWNINSINQPIKNGSLQYVREQFRYYIKG